MILFFSGTGNSRYVAERIADKTKDAIFSINDNIKKKEKAAIDSQAPLVFVTPTYAWRIPRLVEKWIKSMEFSGNKKTYFVMTCGDAIGNAEKYLKKLCSEKNFEYMGCGEIVMPENFITMFHAPEKEEAVALIHKAEPQIEKTAEFIKRGEKLPQKKMGLKDNVNSGLINDVFYPLFVNAKKYYATDACIGCGLCEKKCPLNNIKLADGKPVWRNDCTQCMACICGCPKDAIEYGKKSLGKTRYHFPL